MWGNWWSGQASTGGQIRTEQTTSVYAHYIGNWDFEISLTPALPTGPFIYNLSAAPNPSTGSPYTSSQLHPILSTGPLIYIR